ncbi:hypothetical protein ACFLQL_00440 [Verrucomicrobiota bacterium]
MKKTEKADCCKEEVNNYYDKTVIDKTAVIIVVIICMTLVTGAVLLHDYATHRISKSDTTTKLDCDSRRLIPK